MSICNKCGDYNSGFNYSGLPFNNYNVCRQCNDSECEAELEMEARELEIEKLKLEIKILKSKEVL